MLGALGLIFLFPFFLPLWKTRFFSFTFYLRFYFLCLEIWLMWFFCQERNLFLGPGDKMTHENNDVNCPRRLAQSTPLSMHMCAPSWSYANIHWVVSIFLFSFQWNSAYTILLLRNVLLTLITWFGWKWMYHYGSHHLVCTNWSQIGTWSVVGQSELFPGFQNLEESEM